MSSGWVAPKASRYTIVSTNNNPDSGVTLPLYSCAVSHVKKNKLRAKPRAHVGVMWLREVIGMGEYLGAKVFKNKILFPTIFAKILSFHKHTLG